MDQESTVSPRANAGARGEYKVKVTMMVTPTVKASLVEKAGQFNISMSELIEQLFRGEISFSLEQQRLGEC